MLRNKKVLVTGSAGFIGSHLVEKLLELNCHVRSFVRYNSRNNLGCLEFVPTKVKNNVEIFQGDLLNPDSVNRAVKDIDIVFHLGCLIAIPYSYVNPREVVNANVLGTYNILEASRKEEVKKIVHTSSSEVYGTAQFVPINENHPLQAQSPYSASKIAADKLAESFYLSYDLPVATVRPFNTYGPRQSARAVIPTIITQILSGETVYLGSMNPTRDFTYVEDTVEGIIKIAESKDTIGKVINIGSGKEITIGELTDKIIEITEGGVKVIFDANRVRPEQSEVERLCADITKAKELLKWAPKVSLKEGLKRTIEWFSEHLNYYKPNIYNI